MITVTQLIHALQQFDGKKLVFIIDREDSSSQLEDACPLIEIGDEIAIVSHGLFAIDN